MKRRSSNKTFNPEKFLAQDIQAKAKIGVRQRKRAPFTLRSSIIVLSDDFKRKLYDLLVRLKPELFHFDGWRIPESTEVTMRDFLKMKLEQENLKVSKALFDQLCFDFLHESFFERRDRFKMLVEKDRAT
jgi:hypothetical protein